MTADRSFSDGYAEDILNEGKDAGVLHLKVMSRRFLNVNPEAKSREMPICESGSLDQKC